MTARGTRRPLWVVGLTVAVCALVLVLAGPAGAALAKDWRIADLDVLLDVQENGDVLVDETWTYTFVGNYHFVERDLPLADMYGVSDIYVKDSNGIVLPESGTDAPGTVRVYDEGGYRYIRVNFDVTDASVAFTFHYRSEQEILFWDDGDELRWYVFNAEIPVPIGSLTTTVRLPGSVSPDQMTREVQTGYGVQWTADSPAPSTAVFEASDIPPYTNFWIVTGFPKDVVKYVLTPRRFFDWLIPKLGFALPILTFLTMLLIWFRRGRDQPGTVYAKYITEPPSDLAPGLVGALIDEKVDTKEVMATIVDLARRGYIEITDSKEEGFIRKPLTTFTKKADFDGLLGFEKATADALFSLGSEGQVTTKQLKNHFYSKIPPIVEQIYERVTQAGLFFRNPSKARTRWFRYGIFVGVILAIFSYVLRRNEITGYGWFIAGSIITVLIIWGFSRSMPQRTPAGAQEQKKWEAFRNYLEDLTRFTDMEAAKEKYDLYLPYAMAFGVEKQWTRRFEDLTVPAPDWYHPPVIVVGQPYTGPIGGGIGGPIGGGAIGGGGGGGFSLDSLSDSLFSSLGNVSNVLTSAPSSSGSGSRGAFGGGGFSGGGGGFGGGFSGGGGGGGMHAG